jgi:hypothetical protein
VPQREGGDLQLRAEFHQAFDAENLDSTLQRIRAKKLEMAQKWVVTKQDELNRLNQATDASEWLTQSRARVQQELIDRQNHITFLENAEPVYLGLGSDNPVTKNVIQRQGVVFVVDGDRDVGIIPASSETAISDLKIEKKQISATCTF